jgi:D-serine dehydratase
MLDIVGRLAEAGKAEGWFAPGEMILTAGGSAHFDLAAELLKTARPDGNTHVVLRSGCYLSHDALYYGRMHERMQQRSPDLWGGTEGLRNALEVWAIVQSVPEAGRAICGLGRRDVSFDMELPVPLWWLRPGLHDRPQSAPPGLVTTTLFDQHAYVDVVHGVGPMPWQVGDYVGFGIAHPCTTFDKWPLLQLVDDNYRVVGGVRTFF